MLSDYLHQLSEPQAEWTDILPGVRVCRFDLSASSGPELLSLPVHGSPLPFETLFCQRGRLLAELPQGRLAAAESQEIFLLSDASQLRTYRISRDLKGILVSADAAAARNSLHSVCSALGLQLDTAQVREWMKNQEGCAVLSGLSWTSAVFESLEHLSREAQGQYCVLKAVELLYLFCTGCTAIQQKDPACPGGSVVRCIIQIRNYMETHLSEKNNHFGIMPQIPDFSHFIQNRIPAHVWNLSAPLAYAAADEACMGTSSVHRHDHTGGCPDRRLRRSKPVQPCFQAALRNDSRSADKNVGNRQNLSFSLKTKGFLPVIILKHRKRF